MFHIYKGCNPPAPGSCPPHYADITPCSGAVDLPPRGVIWEFFFSSLQNKVPSRVFDFKDKKKIENKKTFSTKDENKNLTDPVYLFTVCRKRTTKNFLHKVSSRHSAPLRRWRRGRMLCIAIMFYENLHILVFVYFTSVVLGRFVAALFVCSLLVYIFNSGFVFLPPMFSI